jgi:hypothetical protein
MNLRAALGRFWQEERGSLLVTDWAFVATILMLGILSVAAAARSRLHSEQADFQSTTGAYQSN